MDCHTVNDGNCYRLSQIPGGDPEEDSRINEARTGPAASGLHSGRFDSHACSQDTSIFAGNRERNEVEGHLS